MIDKILETLFIPLFIGAFLEFWKKNARAGILCLFLAAGLAAYVVIDHYRNLDACASSAELFPEDLPDRQQDTDCRKFAGSDIVIVHAGSSLFFVQPPFKHVDVIKIGLHTLLALDRTPRGLLVSSDLFTRSGNLLATIRQNKIDFSAGAVSCKRPDLSTFSVTTLGGRELLFVRLRNSSTIEVRGRFAYPDAPPVRITATRIDRGSPETAWAPYMCVGGSHDNPLIQVSP